MFDQSQYGHISIDYINVWHCNLQNIKKLAIIEISQNGGPKIQ
jgi:hypothetical protein